ncbi:hypothetical protein B7492_29665 (plasmid) [Bacillus mycoides]|uniref:Uncharacterized protein n=1 Tax=Bacillus mycoides TaxID=1405 RepID=A0A1W6AHE1_BACMY|nr:hypothetical protein [Bacillus mycoides]ARJ25278.1 hypothetical protein B7492_29665 [Bacillus mycoides]
MTGCGNDAELDAKNEGIKSLKAEINELQTQRQGANVGMSINSGEKITPISIHREDTNLPSCIDLDGFSDLRKGMTIEETYRTVQREASSGRTNSIDNQRTIEYEFRSGTGSKSIKINYKDSKMVRADYVDNEGNYKSIY